MIEPRNGRRNLKVGDYYNQHLPEQQYDWRDDELQAWRAYLIASGKWNTSVARGWDNMMRCRQDEQGLVNRVVYRSYGSLPIEVLAQIPAATIAQGAYWRCPRVARLSHRLAGLLKDVCAAGGKPNVAAMHRMRDELRPLAQEEWALALHCNGVTLVGDLRIRLHDGVFDIHLGGNTIIATGSCRDAATPILKRFARGWACLVRMVIASALRHAVGSFGRTLATPLQFALPAAVAGKTENAVAIERGSVKFITVTLLSDSITTDEWGARLAVAGQILRAARHSEAIRVAIHRAIDDVSADVPLLQSITFELPTRTEVVSRLDAHAHRFVHARAGAARVPIDDPRAEVFEVWQDDVAVPRHLATFPSLALAVDFEYANRKEITMRLSVVAEDQRIGYRLEEAANG
jgi:hypothetical protein